MARTIAGTNQKGGVGKTTTSVNLAAALALSGQRVLLVDMDPQGNATVGSGVAKNDLNTTVLDVLLGEAAAASALVTPAEAGFDVLPANGDLTAAEVELLQISGRERRLRSALEGVRDRYDFILVDCPPSLNMLTVNALVAADGVLVPLQCEYYALEGLTALMTTIDRVREQANPALRIDGILRTMYDPRNNLATQVSAQLIMHFADKVYRTVIPRNVRLAEAPSHGVPVTLYDRASRGSLSYLALASEMLHRYRREPQAQPA